MNAPPFTRLNVERFAANVPPELFIPKQWVCWYPVWRDGRWTKPPVNPFAGGNAKTNDPSTWSPVADALAFYEKNDWIYGVGFVLVPEGGLVAFDFDDCLTADGEISPDHFAARCVPALNSYTEITPSGQGLRVLVHGVLPDGSKGRRKSKMGTEIYSSGRYVTVTGARWLR